MTSSLNLDAHGAADFSLEGVSGEELCSVVVNNWCALLYDGDAVGVVVAGQRGDTMIMMVAKMMNVIYQHYAFSLVPLLGALAAMMTIIIKREVIWGGLFNWKRVLGPTIL